LNNTSIRVLFLSPEAPYPLSGGGSFRTAALLHYLADRYTVDAIFFRESGRSDPVRDLPGRLIDDHLIVDLPPHSRSAPARTLRNLSRARRGVPPLNDRFAGHEQAMSAFAKNKRYALGVVEHLWCAPYQDTLNEFCDSMVLDLHNIESVLYERRAASCRWPVSTLHRRFADRARAIERRWLPRYNMVLATSAHDAAIAQNLAPGAKIEVYPNTIPSHPLPVADKRLQIAFSGNFDYDPNQVAVAWLVRHVWPRLAARHPQLELCFIGRNPDAIRAMVADIPRMRITGPVDDAIPALSQSMVAIVPLRTGSGTRIKILEAWAAGLPVVSTSIGAEGLPGKEGQEWLIRDDPEGFARAVSTLLDADETRSRIGAAGRALYESKFTWEAGWKVLDRLGFDYTG
jgi:glycosyltransferase involved in cell wall biosynthesis